MAIARYKVICCYYRFTAHEPHYISDISISRIENHQYHNPEVVLFRIDIRIYSLQLKEIHINDNNDLIKICFYITHSFLTEISSKV